MILQHFDRLSADDERRNKRFLRNAHISKLPHPRYSLRLLFRRFLLARYVAAIAFCGHSLADHGDGFTGDHLASDRRLNRDFVQKAGDQVFSRSQTRTLKCGENLRGLQAFVFTNVRLPGMGS